MVEIPDKEFKKLTETNLLLNSILDTTHMMVAYLDPRFNFIRVNRAYAKADEKDPSFFPGKNHFDLFPNEENKKIFQRVVDTGEPAYYYAKPFEYAEHPERGVSYWDWSLIPVKSPKGKVTDLVLTLVNATKRVQAEDELRKLRDELEVKVVQRTEELTEKVKELQIFHDVTVDRELQMDELRKKIKELESKLKEKPLDSPQ